MTETRNEGKEVIVLNQNNTNKNPKQEENNENAPQSQTKEVMAQNPAVPYNSVEVNLPNLESIQLD